ncbi:MAG: hypothetical protein V1651_03380 [Patescibacteria group bacterium]
MFQEKLTKESYNRSSLPEYIEMYNISGQDPINEHSYDRYKKNKEKEDEAIKKEILNSFDPYIIKDAPKIEQAKLIELGFEQDDVEVKRAAAKMIQYAPENERAELIKLGLEQDDVKVKRAAAEIIWCAPEIEQAKLIELGFEQDDVEVKRAAAKMIQYAPENERAELIKLGLEQDDVEVKREAAEMIWCASENERAKLIELGLEQDDVEVKRVAAEMIWYAIKNERAKLIELGLEQDDVEVKRVAAKMIQYAIKNERAKLIELIQKYNLENILVEPFFYKNIKEKSFLRTPLEKTGSETTLVGGNLKGKVIIRHIKPKSFLVWQKIYENYTLWKENDFDYVPIEPIDSYHLNKKGLVDVYSGVLDINYSQWKNISNQFQTDLEEDMEKIIAVLEKEKIIHGHIKGENFCLRFFRNKQGDVDLSKKPRIYLIDFDMASSENPI